MRGSVPFVLGVLLTTAAAAIIGLFVTSDATQTWDVLKLSIQGIGALIFARFGVVWAIDTFKSQKRWERDAATLSSVLASLREMNRANSILWDSETQTQNYTEEYLKEAGVRWRTARQKFEDAAAISIFLPKEISSIVLKVEADLANSPSHGTYLDDLEYDGHLVSEALRNLERHVHLL